MAAFAVVLTGCQSVPPDPAPAAENTPVLRLGIIGDQTGSYDLDRSYDILEQGVTALNGRDLDLVLHTGDLIESSRSETQIRQDFARATGLLNRLDSPWMLTPGDHDINPPERVANSADRSREKLFHDLLVTEDSSLDGTFWRSRMVKGWRVITLYSHEALHADPRWGVTYLARISDRQLAWLESELAEAEDANGIVVALHQPLWYNWAGWERVHEVLARNHVDLVLAGHTHYTQAEQSLDGVTYHVVGATGGATKHGSPNAGDLQHVTIITLGGQKPDIDLIALDTDAAVSPSPRAAMDRVQALAVMLGSGRFDPVMQPRIKVSSCMVDMPARLIVPGLGNPTDLPLTIAITADMPLTNVSFRKGACLETDATACILPPAYGVARSNNSSVTLDPDVETPFFAASFDPSELSSDGLEVTVSASFTLVGEPYRLTETMSTQSPCTTGD